MADETLLTAARRALRFFRIDESHGGLTSRDTLIAMDTLDLQVQKEAARQKRLQAELDAQAAQEAGQ